MTIAFFLLQQKLKLRRIQAETDTKCLQYPFKSLPPTFFLPTNKISIFSHHNLSFSSFSENLYCLKKIKKWCSKLALLLGTGREVAAGLKGTVCSQLKQQSPLSEQFWEFLEQWRHNPTFPLTLQSLTEPLLQHCPCLLLWLWAPGLIICSKSLPAAPKMNNLGKSYSSWCPGERLATDTFVGCLFYFLSMRSPRFSSWAYCSSWVPAWPNLELWELHWFVSSGNLGSPGLASSTCFLWISSGQNRNGPFLALPLFLKVPQNSCRRETCSVLPTVVQEW